MRDGVPLKEAPWQATPSADGLTSNSLESMLSVLTAALGECTLEHLAGAPTEIERWLAVTRVVLIAAALLAQSFVKLQHADLGYDPRNLVSVSGASRKFL